MTNYLYPRNALTGGTSGAIDYLDGDSLTDLDIFVSGDGGNENIYFHLLDDDLAGSESSPLIIAPDSNPGNKRAALATVVHRVARSEFIHIEDPRVVDGTAAPDAAATYTSGNGKTRARTFAHDSSEDVLISWDIPLDIIAASGIKFQVALIVTDATGPSAEGVSFKLSGDCVGDGGPLGVTFGTEIESSKTAITEVQYDLLITDLSGVVTVDDLAASETAILKLYRDHDDADDDYGQVIGVRGLWLYWEELTSRF